MEKEVKSKKKHLAPKTMEGRPLSLAAMTGSSSFNPWPATQRGKKTEAVVRNDVKMPDITNIPSNFHWTDVPILAKQRPKFDGKENTNRRMQSNIEESVENEVK